MGPMNFIARILGVSIAEIATVSTAEAQGNPCAFQPIDLAKYGGDTFRNPPETPLGLLKIPEPLVVEMARNVIAGCNVTLRSYDGGLVGRTFSIRPGQTLHLVLLNDLENTLNPRPMTPWWEHNGPADFNVTNFHTHGWHVDPNGFSDNVLRHMMPKTTNEIKIQVPADHPPGTFWYHAHLHGSTALQVSSGMAGALIVKGGLDDVPQIAAAKDQVFVFQQIVYDENGELNNYDNFGPGAWARTQRHTLINGQLAPTIRMRPGEVQRWRFIHAGIRESLSLQLEGHILREIAVDGLALGRIEPWDVVQMYPGYRSDVLVKAGGPGTYRLMDRAIDAASPTLSSALLNEPENEAVLATVIVTGDPVSMALPTDADVAGLKPHKDITTAELDGAEEQVIFSIRQAICDPAVPGSACKPCPQGSNDPQCGASAGPKFMINDRPFSTAHEIAPKLGTAAEWTIGQGHPFHIHVNPFQVDRVGSDNVVRPVWRDTLFVPTGRPLAKIRSRFERYTGDFVLHCHILDHEDNGMMSLVSIK